MGVAAMTAYDESKPKEIWRMTDREYEQIKRNHRNYYISIGRFDLAELEDEEENEADRKARIEGPTTDEELKELKQKYQKELGKDL
jgi:hypothetical protein